MVSLRGANSLGDTRQKIREEHTGLSYKTPEYNQTGRNEGRLLSAWVSERRDVMYNYLNNIELVCALPLRLAVKIVSMLLFVAVVISHSHCLFD